MVQSVSHRLLGDCQLRAPAAFYSPDKNHFLLLLFVTIRVFTLLCIHVFFYFLSPILRSCVMTVVERLWFICALEISLSALLTLIILPNY
jgi:hypothetical protein